AILVNLTGRPQTSQNMQLRGTGLRTCLTVGEVNLAALKASRVMGQIEKGEAPLVASPWLPLMNGGGEARNIERWIRAVEQEPDEQRRADYAGLALVFAE